MTGAPTTRRCGRAGPPFLCGSELGRLQRAIVPTQRPLGEEDLSAERGVRLHDVDHALIRFLTAPILLQFVDEMLCGGWHGAGLDHAVDGTFMGLNAAIAAGVRDKEHFIAAPEALDHVERGTGARPEAGDDEALATRCFDGLHKVGSEPGVDGRAIDDLVTAEKPLR